MFLSALDHHKFCIVSYSFHKFKRKLFLSFVSGKITCLYFDTMKYKK